MGQRLAYQELLDVAETFFSLDWANMPLRARMDPLVVAPSGVGKSKVVQLVCRKLGLPQLRLTYGEWVVMAARETPHTIQRINAFVEEYPRGLIHIDELDKFKAAHVGEWSTSVFVELFLLLDRSLQQPGRDVQWTEVLQEKLAKSFLIVGTGTWQSIWPQSTRPSIGFGASIGCAPTLVPAEIEKSGMIPPELLRRFNSDLIILPPATETDYREGARTFGLDLMARDLGIELDYAEAVKGGLGARWLEGILSRLLRRAKKMVKPTSPATDPFSSEQPDWDPDDYPSDTPPF
jgi:hypothetical protein